MIFYSHIESCEHLNRNHTKSRNGKLLFGHNFEGSRTLMPSVWNRGCDNPRDRNSHETQRQACFLGCSCPLPMAGGMFLGTPLEL